MDWWVAQLLRDDPALLVSQIVWVIGSIVLHELAHGWAAIRCGDRTPIELGHMTWNPLVHMGKFSLLAFAIAGIAWGVMPVNPSRFRRPSDHAFVAAAGPMMNLSLAVLAAILAGAWLAHGPVGAGVFKPVATFLWAGAFLNLLLCIFNLMPVPPLDGYTILSTYFAPLRRIFESAQGQAMALGLFLLLFLGFGRVIQEPAAHLANRAIRGVAGLLTGGNPF